MLLASTTPLHDLGSFIFSDDALHLKQKVIFPGFGPKAGSRTPPRHRADATRRAVRPDRRNSAEAGFEGCRFAIGIRNANNKRFRLACTVGLRVFVCHNLAFRGDYTPVLAKHSKHFSLEDALSIGVDRMQRNFDPMRQQVERWRVEQLSPEVARLMIYRAFIEGELEVPKHLARRVHDLYFNPQHEEFAPRTMWSLSNAFTSAFKELDPIPQFKATAKLGEFLEAKFSESL